MAKEKKAKREIEVCNDSKCPIHGELSSRGRSFVGMIVKKFPKRAVVEVERTIYNKKYERYSRAKSKLHAYLPECMKEIRVGDIVKIQECRPLSKIIHFVVISKIRESSSNKSVYQDSR